MIFYIMGRSSTGKDTLYSKILESNLNLEPIITFTTRPMRPGEKKGREYYFVDNETRIQMESDGKVLESRCYHTVNGDWWYFTDKEFFEKGKNYIGIGTLESFKSIKSHLKNDIVPIYIDIEDDYELLTRALKREKNIKENYSETCRRYLADLNDFSKENIEEAGITNIFYNDNLDECFENIVKFINNFIR